MAEVVKLKRAGPIDLRGNNRFRDLLETHVTQVAIMVEAKKRKDEADEEIRSIMGDAPSALIEGFSVSVLEYEVPEYTVKASTRTRMSIRRRRR